MARLDGLHSPAQVEVGITPSEDELARWVAAIVATEIGPLPEEMDIFDAELIEGEPDD